MEPTVHDLLGSPAPRPANPWVQPDWKWFAAAGWCALLGWFAFLQSQRVPLLGFADFGFHELGHLVMYVFPISAVLTAAMGSGLQIAVPAGLALYFVLARRDLCAGIVCAAWAATAMQDVSVYIADAPYEQLQLVGGEHDWAFILGPEHFDRLESAAAIAAVVRGAGMLVLFGALTACCYGWTRRGRAPVSTRASGPATPTEWTASDLLPKP